MFDFRDYFGKYQRRQMFKDFGFWQNGPIF